MEKLRNLLDRKSGGDEDSGATEERKEPPKPKPRLHHPRTPSPTPRLSSAPTQRASTEYPRLRSSTPSRLNDKPTNDKPINVKPINDKPKKVTKRFTTSGGSDKNSGHSNDKNVALKPNEFHSMRAQNSDQKEADSEHSFANSQDSRQDFSTVSDAGHKPAPLADGGTASDVTETAQSKTETAQAVVTVNSLDYHDEEPSRSVEEENEEEEKSDDVSVDSIGDYGLPRDRAAKKDGSEAGEPRLRWTWSLNFGTWGTLERDRAAIYLALVIAFFLTAFNLYFSLDTVKAVDAFQTLHATNVPVEKAPIMGHCSAPCRIDKQPGFRKALPEFSRLNIADLPCNDFTCLPNYEVKEGYKDDGKTSDFLDFSATNDNFKVKKNRLCSEVIREFIQNNTVRPEGKTAPPVVAPGKIVVARVSSCVADGTDEETATLTLRIVVCHDHPKIKRLSHYLCGVTTASPPPGHFKSHLFIYVESKTPKKRDPLG